MPTYEYQCQKCGHEFERDQRIVEDPIKKCPSCKALKAKRLISKTSFVLKGGGWYDDLYSSTPSETKDDAESSKSDSSDSSDSTSSDDDKSKPKKDKAASSESKSDSKSESKKKKKDTGKKKSAA